MSDPGFWSDQEQARVKSKRLDYLKKTVEGWQEFERQANDLSDLSELNDKEGDAKISHDIAEKYHELLRKYEAFRISTLLSEKYDDHNSLLSVHAGAGGTDAQDWAAMLMRMYMRYAQKEGYEVDVLDKSDGAEAGIKSVVLSVRGPYAFGHLKSEAGVHRLIRLSPYNPAHTRETSFALVEVLPELERHEETALDPKDLNIEVSTASGHGGQSVNTTYSAVRITHIPTGLKVSIQNERSQLQNKAQAMKILQSRLKVLEEENARKERLQIRGEFHSAEWGNQIRSYTLHPYKLIKDHRTGYESSSPEAVLEGELGPLITSYLEFSRGKLNS